VLYSAVSPEDKFGECSIFHVIAASGSQPRNRMIELIEYEVNDLWAVIKRLPYGQVVGKGRQGDLRTC
jgi:hypothetical protein